MANVTFTRLTDASATASTTQGLITFNTGNHTIYLGDGTSAISMDLGFNKVTVVSKTDTTLTTTDVSGSQTRYSSDVYSIPGIVVGFEGVSVGGWPASSKPSHSITYVIASGSIKANVTMSYTARTTQINTYGSPTNLVGKIWYIPVG